MFKNHSKLSHFWPWERISHGPISLKIVVFWRLCSSSNILWTIQSFYEFTKYWNDSQSIGIFLKILESFTKYWNSLGMPPKTSNLTVMHLKLFKSRFSKNHLTFFVTKIVFLEKVWIFAPKFIYQVCAYSKIWIFALKKWQKMEFTFILKKFEFSRRILPKLTLHLKKFEF